jgi:hypothetical protein
MVSLKMVLEVPFLMIPFRTYSTRRVICWYAKTKDHLLRERDASRGKAACNGRGFSQVEISPREFNPLDGLHAFLDC